MLTRYVRIRLWTWWSGVSEMARDPALLPHSVQIQDKGHYDRLTNAESVRQRSSGMRYVIRKAIVVTCVYNGSPETITVPVDRVFDGDSLKTLFGIADDGIAWAVHDWLYNTHAFDTKSDGTTTEILNRWSVDELMYILLVLEGYPLYGWVLQAADIFIFAKLDLAWETRQDNTFVESTVDTNTPTSLQPP